MTMGKYSKHPTTDDCNMYAKLSSSFEDGWQRSPSSVLSHVSVAEAFIITIRS